MHLVKLIPKCLLRHKIIEILLKLRLQQNVIKFSFNNNSQAFIDLSDPEPRNIFLRTEFENEFFSIANCLVPPNGTFFDLGANHGLCTFGLLPKFLSTKFHLFEANKDLVEIILQSTQLYPDISFIVTHACISDKPGVSKFHLEENQSGQSHVATAIEDGIIVNNLVLDDYCIQNAIKNVDFAKIDLEGHELLALTGWKKFLEEQNVKAIYIEIMPENQRRYSRETIAPLELLESFGYELFFCKEQDFKQLGIVPQIHHFSSQKLLLGHFKSKNYPNHYAADILALAPDN